MTDGDPWRRRCPQGHSEISIFPKGYRCTACDEYYAGEPYDAAETTFPVNDDPEPSVTIGSVVQSVYSHAGDTSTTVRAHELGNRTRAIGKKLQHAREHGLVERIGASSPYKWRLTEDGYQRARPLRNSNVKKLLAGVEDEYGMSPVPNPDD